MLTLVVAAGCGQAVRDDRDSSPVLDASTDPVEDAGSIKDGGIGAADANASDAGDAAAPDVGTVWSTVASMPEGRIGHTAALVGGRVLVAGGDTSTSLADSYTAAIYDPTSGGWTPAKNMLSPHRAHCSALVSSGKLLMAGGLVGFGYGASATAVAEVFDPTTGNWTPAASSMNPSRYFHECALLPGGAVLATGGIISPLQPKPTSSTEVFDPVGGWTPAAPMMASRAGHTATPLDDGTVLIAGGGSANDTFVASAELFNPTTGAFVPTGSLNTARGGHRAVKLLNGNVLVVGGSGNEIAQLASAELYDAGQGVWSPTDSMANGRGDMTVTLLSSGKVLVVGGQGLDKPLATAELYDPVSGLWSSAGAMAVARVGHAATLLPSGKVLVTGGLDADYKGPINSAELFDPSAL